MKKERILWVDILNICACIGVLVLHTTNKQIHTWDGQENLDFWFGLMTHTLFYWPVPVFLMLSGFNLFTPPNQSDNLKIFYKKRFLKTVIPFFLWSMIYTIPVLIKQKSSCSEIITGIVQCKFNGYLWFFIPLFAFYLSFPILNRWIKKAPISEVLFYFTSGIILLFIVQPCFKLLNLGFFNYVIFPVGGSLLLYPVLGCVLYKYELFINYRKTIYYIGIVAVFVHFVMLYVSITVLNSSLRFQNTEELTSLLMASAIFVWFMNQNWQKLLCNIHLSASIVQKLSSCSLGVYLLQFLLFAIFRKIGLPFHTPFVGAILTYMIAVPIVIVMKQVPGIRYLVP